MGILGEIHEILSGNAGHAAERGPDRDRPDPTRTDAKTQTNSIYLAQVPQNSRFWSFQQQKARREQFWFHSVVILSSMLAISRFAKHWFGSFQQHRARKAKNCSKSSFSGLRTEFQEQPINTKHACQILYTTTPKSKELLQKLAFGAVDGIPKAANEYKTCLSDPTTAPRSTSVSE